MSDMYIFKRFPSLVETVLAKQREELLAKQNIKAEIDALPPIYKPTITPPVFVPSNPPGIPSNNYSLDYYPVRLKKVKPIFTSPPLPELKPAGCLFCKKLVPYEMHKVDCLYLISKQEARKAGKI